MKVAIHDLFTILTIIITVISDCVVVMDTRPPGGGMINSCMGWALAPTCRKMCRLGIKGFPFWVGLWGRGQVLCWVGYVSYIVLFMASSAGVADVFPNGSYFGNRIWSWFESRIMCIRQMHSGFDDFRPSIDNWSRPLVGVFGRKVNLFWLQLTSDFGLCFRLTSLSMDFALDRPQL